MGGGQLGERSLGRVTRLPEDSCVEHGLETHIVTIGDGRATVARSMLGPAVSHKSSPCSAKRVPEIVGEAKRERLVQLGWVWV